jgi:KDO2-lipid IV(A) lauroyltransferase
MLYFLLRLLSSLPLAVFQGIGAIIGIMVYAISPNYRKKLNTNIRNAAAYAGFKASPWRAACESGMMFADTLWIWRYPKSAIRKVKIADLENIINLSKKGQGLIILASHFGGFEIVPRIFAEHLKATVMYRPARKEWLNQLMIKSREHPQMEFVEANLGGVRKIKRALKNGEVVGILADQVPSVSDGVWAKFFNQYAYTTSFPVKLSRQENVTTVFVSAQRLSFGRGWELKSKVLQEAYPEDAVEACTVMNRYFEEMIVTKPNQYMWSYNRYKSPTGATKPPIN